MGVFDERGYSKTLSISKSNEPKHTAAGSLSVYHLFTANGFWRVASTYLLNAGVFCRGHHCGIFHRYFHQFLYRHYFSCVSFQRSKAAVLKQISYIKINIHKMACVPYFRSFKYLCKLCLKMRILLKFWAPASTT